MSIEYNKSLYDLAKDMLIKGKSFEEIMDKTHLRLKDIKRIQAEEINTHF